MKVVLEPFALASIEDRFGTELNLGVEASLRHYARRLRSQRRPPEVPLFMREIAIDREAATEVDVSPPYEIFLALSREAGRQEVEFDRIVAHAVFVYLADIEAGGRPGADAAEEDGASSRYPGHAIRQIPSARRPDGAMAGGSHLRRGPGAGGRSRFGRR